MGDNVAGEAYVPHGEGLVIRRLRIAKQDVYFLGGILNGYDHLVSIHGDDSPGELTLVAPQSRAAELDALLLALHDEIDFDVSEPDCSG